MVVIFILLLKNPARMSAIHFIGGEKGGVGKSVVARLLAQYWIDQDQPWRGFDTDRSHGAFTRHYQDFATSIDASRLEDLDQIVEVVSGGEKKILVDLAAQTEARLHTWIESGGILDFAPSIGVEVTFWHVLDDGKDATSLLERLLGRYGEDARYVVVLNRGRGTDFSTFEASDVAARVKALDIPVIELRALHRPTMLRIDRLDKSFWAAVNNKGEDALTLMERQRVKVWMQHAYRAFTQLGV